MPNLRSKGVLICDHGLYVSLALRMARDFGRVGYHNLSWKRGFPTYQEYDVGTGFEEITPEPDLFDALKRYELIWFPDCLNGDMQVFLRDLARTVPEFRHLRVFGSGLGEEIELDRIMAKELMAKVGLPVGPYRVETGMDALEQFLAKNPEWFVKVSRLRGITETFGGLPLWLMKPRLDELRHSLGIRQEFQRFLVEKKIETNIEYGFDGICVDGKFGSIAANGVEKKDVAYACVVQRYEQLPEGMRKVNDALAKWLGERQYRNWWSTEIRQAKDGTPYAIDFTARQPSPAGESEQELWSNLAEMAYEGAAGVLVDAKPSAKYAVQSIIYGDRADESCQPVEFSEEYRDNVKLFFECRHKGKSYVIPQVTKMNEIGSVVTTGDKLEDVVKENREIAETIQGDKINIHTDKIDAVLEEFEEMANKGMDIAPYSA